MLKSSNPRTASNPISENPLLALFWADMLPFKRFDGSLIFLSTVFTILHISLPVVASSTPHIDHFSVFLPATRKMIIIGSIVFAAFVILASLTSSKDLLPLRLGQEKGEIDVVMVGTSPGFAADDVRYMVYLRLCFVAIVTSSVDHSVLWFRAFVVVLQTPRWKWDVSQAHKLISLVVFTMSVAFPYFGVPHSTFGSVDSTGTSAGFGGGS